MDNSEEQYANDPHHGASAEDMQKYSGEPQYSNYDKIPRHSLGLMSNQVWHDDPKMLGIHLARYKFVAKMLAGKERVAEIGCGDGFYSHVVEKEVERLDLYDFDKKFAAENDKIILQDILQAPISKKYVNDSNVFFKYEPYDAIYSLDVMEHIAPDKEHTYIRNIAQSLTDIGVFIVGMPSLESQKYANEASKIGHVNCKSGDNLRDILRLYFHNVFLFSMHDEVVTTAFSSMAHYLIGVCVGVR